MTCRGASRREIGELHSFRATTYTIGSGGFGKVPRPVKKKENTKGNKQLSLTGPRERVAVHLPLSRNWIDAAI